MSYDCKSDVCVSWYFLFVFQVICPLLLYPLLFPHVLCYNPISLCFSIYFSVLYLTSVLDLAFIFFFPRFSYVPIFPSCSVRCITVLTFVAPNFTFLFYLSLHFFDFTNPWKRTLIEKLPVSQRVRKYLFCGIRVFIAVSRSCHLALSITRLIVTKNKKFWEVRCRGNVFTELLYLTTIGGYTDPQTLLWYNTDRIENGPSNNSSIVMYVHCRENMFTEPLPSNERRERYIQTQTGEKDFWNTPLRWAQVPQYKCLV
jgi:hypothetical protein